MQIDYGGKGVSIEVKLKNPMRNAASHGRLSKGLLINKKEGKKRLVILKTI